MFEKASRLKLRFDTSRGNISAEDLWDLPLESTTGKVCLDSVARDIDRDLKSAEEVSFVTPAAKKDEVNQLRLEIVKHIIAVKIAERDAASKARERAEQKQRILALISEKEDKALADKPLEELKALASTL